MQGVYFIAGVIVKISYAFNYTGEVLKNYAYKGDSPHQAEVEITKADIEYEDKVFPGNPEHFLENLAVLRKLAKVLLVGFNAMLFHGSSIEYEGKAYVFTAPSGTGKSTHASLLKKLLGDKLRYINDDKPIFRVIDNKVYVCGSPWNGKHGLGSNISAPLKAVCIIKRDKQNKIEQIQPNTALKFLFEQSLAFQDEESANKVLDVLFLVLSQAKFYVLHCNKDLDAARCSYEGMIYED